MSLFGPPPGDDGRSDVGGMGVESVYVEEVPPRPNVVVVASEWGEFWGERQNAIRQIAGALALRAEVSIVSLEDHSRAPKRPAERMDGIFRVFSANAPRSRPGTREVLTAALSRRDVELAKGPVVPEYSAQRLLLLDERPCNEALALACMKEADVVVVAGPEPLPLWLFVPVLPRRPRLVLVPLLGADGRIASPALGSILDAADSVIALSPLEESLLGAGDGGERRHSVSRLTIPVVVNRSAAAHAMAGTASFGPYVLVISCFPDGDPRRGASPGHDYLRSVVGEVSVAEVRHGTWLVSERGRLFPMPWGANRTNLWRLMAHALATLELRPSGPVGQEVLESMLLGTPVVAPAGTVEGDHALRANGGLVYQSLGEAFDALSWLVEHPSERSALGSAGREFVERDYEGRDDFVDEVCRMVLG